jgi:hypothetical protein
MNQPETPVGISTTKNFTKNKKMAPFFYYYYFFFYLNLKRKANAINSKHKLSRTRLFGIRL